MDIETKITKLQDGDGHWYWVPNEIVEVFNIDVRHIVGSTYTEYPEMFDAFIDKYDKYLMNTDTTSHILLGSWNNIENRKS